MEAYQYQLTFNAYLTAKDPSRSLNRDLGIRKNNKFINRLSVNAKHSKIDLFEFLNVHGPQYGYFKHSNLYTYQFIFKYLLN